MAILNKETKRNKQSPSTYQWKMNLSFCNVIFIRKIWGAQPCKMSTSFLTYSSCHSVYSSSVIIKTQARSIWWVSVPHKEPCLLNLEDSTVIFHRNFCLWDCNQNYFLGCAFCCFNICGCFGYALLALFSVLQY